MADNKGPWGNKGGKKGSNPWNTGGKPDRSRPKPGDASPDLENVIQGFKTRVRKTGGGGGPRGFGNGGLNGPLAKFGPFGIVLVGGLIMMLLSCFYQVAQQEEAIILRFGKYSRTTASGLHLKLPMPVEEVMKINVTSERSVGSKKNLILTGDENIADVDFTVRWNVKAPKDYIFNLEDAEAVVADAADSAIREVIGKKNLEYVITDGRNPIELEVKALLQEMLDEYESGVTITVVQLQRTEAPPKVIKAFEDVVTAEQEQEQRVIESA